MTSTTTLSLDLVKVTSTFQSKALTYISPSATTAAKASFSRKWRPLKTLLVEDGGNFGVILWLGFGNGTLVSHGDGVGSREA